MLDGAPKKIQLRDTFLHPPCRAESLSRWGEREKEDKSAAFFFFFFLKKSARRTKFCAAHARKKWGRFFLACAAHFFSKPANFFNEREEKSAQGEARKNWV